MDPNYSDKNASELASRMESIGRFINSKVNIFHIESTINNQMFAKPLEFLGKNEDELSPFESFGLKNLVRTLNVLPQTRQAIFERVPAPYGVIKSIWKDQATREKSSKVLSELAVPVGARILCIPPYISPYNVGAFLNPSWSL